MQVSPSQPLFQEKKHPQKVWQWPDSQEDAETVEVENRQSEKPQNSPKKKKAATIISEIVFYLVLVVMVLSALAFGAGNNGTKKIFGYSYANVLTTSMQTEIPKGSLVLIRETAPDTLNVGDDITYITETNTTVTHRIMEIYENYEDSGMRGFTTQGTENPMPDKEVVFAENVIGKVIFSVPKVGSVLLYLKQNFIVAIGLFLVVIGLFFSVKTFFKYQDKEKKQSPASKTKKPKRAH